MPDFNCTSSDKTWAIMAKMFYHSLKTVVVDLTMRMLLGFKPGTSLHWGSSANHQAAYDLQDVKKHTSDWINHPHPKTKMVNTRHRCCVVAL